MLLRPSRVVRGQRPQRGFQLNRESPQAVGLYEWWPLTPNMPLQAWFQARHNLTPVGTAAIWRSTPILGLAPYFQGGATDEYTVSAANSQDIADNTLSSNFGNGPYAISCWVCGLQTGVADYGIFGRWAGSVGAMLWYHSGALKFGDGTSSAVVWAGGQAATQDGNPHHIMGINTGSNAMELWVDGVRQATGSGSGAGNGSSVILDIGTYANAAGGRVNSVITDCRFYGYVGGLPLVPRPQAFYDPATRWDLYWVPSSRVFFQLPAGGGTTFTQSVAGTLTDAGALLKQTNTLKAGTLTDAGAIVRQTSKLLAGTLTDAGALVKQTNRSLAGTLTSSGALAALKTVLKALAGTLTSSGTILKQVGKAAGGTVGPVGTCARFITHALGGALTAAGALVSSLNGVIATPPINLGARSLASSLGASLRRLTSSLGTPTRRGTGSGPQGQS